MMRLENRRPASLFAAADERFIRVARAIPRSMPRKINENLLPAIQELVASPKSRDSVGERTENQLASRDRLCLTISLTAFPSARPATLAMTAFMTLPMSFGPAAWVS